jgi:prepilin-type processing-associated H-X9-DG protein
MPLQFFVEPSPRLGHGPVTGISCTGHPYADARKPGKGCAVRDRRRHEPWGRRQGDGRGRFAFTLIETLVCVGLVTVVVSILLPSIGAARRQARLVVCTSNVRHICRALQTYAGMNDGRFPPNVSAPAPGQFWCDRKRMDGMLGDRTPPNVSSLGGGALACPEDEGGQRSYAMNIWASGAVDGFVRREAPARGEFWSATSGGSSQLILVAEAWSAFGSGEWFTAREWIGFAGDRPGQRFGGGAGISPPIPYGRAGIVNSELAFARHRIPGGRGAGVQPYGRVQIGYADGHVELHAHSDLVQPDGKSTYRSLWTPVDRRIDQQTNP